MATFGYGEEFTRADACLYFILAYCLKFLINSES